MPYIGRFAPSPTGPLHAGSLVAALASWLDARANGGRWLVRIEDVDAPRCVARADAVILAQLAALGMTPDAPPLWQSQRGADYGRALGRLRDAGLTYPCCCTRAAIEAHWHSLGVRRVRHAEWPYPGTCRHAVNSPADEHGAARAWRVRTDGAPVEWVDRRLGAQTQHVGTAVGDFVLRRADGVWAYQLAVVVDDADQGVTHVVRGEDLADNTPRQRHLQRLLGLAAPVYLHTPLVRGPDGDKLSKQHGAPSIDTRAPLAALQAAALPLALPPLAASGVTDWLAAAVAAWPKACVRLRQDAAKAAEGPAKADTMALFPNRDFLP